MGGNRILLQCCATRVIQFLRMLYIYDKFRCGRKVLKEVRVRWSYANAQRHVAANTDNITTGNTRKVMVPITPLLRGSLVLLVPSEWVVLVSASCIMWVFLGAILGDCFTGEYSLMAITWKSLWASSHGEQTNAWMHIVGYYFAWTGT